jgi:hypothetical protein
MSGRTILFEELGPATRWNPRCKSIVVERIHNGELTREEAMRRFALSTEELDGWIDRRARHGIDGLSVTRLQEVGR